MSKGSKTPVEKLMGMIECDRATDAVVGNLEGRDGIYVRNNATEQESFIACGDITEENYEHMFVSLGEGKRVDHITRVTGFFSKISGWNKGKKAELKQRYRSDVDGKKEDEKE